MDKASDYESGDCRFESCQDQHFFKPKEKIVFLGMPFSLPTYGIDDMQTAVIAELDGTNTPKTYAPENCNMRWIEVP